MHHRDADEFPTDAASPRVRERTPPPPPRQWSTAPTEGDNGADHYCPKNVVEFWCCWLAALAWPRKHSLERSAALFSAAHLRFNHVAKCSPPTDVSTHLPHGLRIIVFIQGRARRLHRNRGPEQRSHAHRTPAAARARISAGLRIVASSVTLQRAAGAAGAAAAAAPAADCCCCCCCCYCCRHCRQHCRD